MEFMILLVLFVLGVGLASFTRRKNSPLSIEAKTTTAKRPTSPPPVE